MTPPGLSIMQRFMMKVRSDWQWIGCKRHGYGVMGIGHKMVDAHRISYELFNGPIPEGMWVLHSCDDPGCVDPEHLHLGNSAMNTKEMHARGRNYRTFGEQNGNSKLTITQVIEIKELYASKKYSQIEIANMFNVGKSCINHIVSNYNWKKQ